MKTIFTILAICLSFGCGDAQRKFGPTSKFYYKKQFKQQLALANKADANAQYEVGKMYIHDGIPPNVIPYNLKEAIKWFEKAALLGHAEAANKLGNIYGGNYPTLIDDMEALKWYEKAALLGHAQAEKSVEVIYETILISPSSAEDYPDGYKEAAKWYKKKAVKGDVDAQWNLIRSYEKLGDLEEAEKWIHKMAETGDDRAQIRLAQLYLRQRNYMKAIKLLQKAAESSNSSRYSAMGSLCKLYSGDHEGLPRDLLLFGAWHYILEINIGRGRYARKVKMTPEQITKAEALAKEMIKKNPKLIKQK